MLIKLIENTGYHYDSVLRFYGWEYASSVLPVKDCGAANIAEFYLACLKAWSRETCSKRFRPDWSEENPSVGQCTITAALVREYFGGEILSLPLYGSGRHNFNLIDGRIVDLACEQFGRDALLDFDSAEPTDPDALLSDDEKRGRCELLRKRLTEILG